MYRVFPLHPLQCYRWVCLRNPTCLVTGQLRSFRDVTSAHCARASLWQVRAEAHPSLSVDLWTRCDVDACQISCRSRLGRVATLRINHLVYYDPITGILMLKPRIFNQNLRTLAMFYRTRLVGSSVKYLQCGRRSFGWFHDRLWRSSSFYCFAIASLDSLLP